MTKDWDSVRAEIRDLSVNHKKCLQEVKSIMEEKHKFRASTRAYRMKLKEWGFTRNQARTSRHSRSSSKPDKMNQTRAESEHESDNESEASVEANETAPANKPTEMLSTLDPWIQARRQPTDIVMDMLECVLVGDCTKLEQQIMANPSYMNYPIGLPFEAPGDRFFNHPALKGSIIMQHPDQTILDIACALPHGPVPWLLLDRGAKGTSHPLGTDLAFFNAIRNNRTFTVQALIFLGKSDVNGTEAIAWRPLMQAVLWSSVDVVRVLLDRGARVNEASPTLDGTIFKTALQYALDRRISNFLDLSMRPRSENIIKMLLDAGADVHVPPAPITSPEDPALTPFEAFLKPWDGSMLWTSTISATDLYCLELFIRKGAQLNTRFAGFPCSSPTGNTFQHQIIWHGAPNLARLLVDHASPVPGANGSQLLHEIVGSCPDAKRHPAETLRDIDVLVKQGADPNRLNVDGFSPLRICIKHCPSVDIKPRLKALLLAGADPEPRDSTGSQPVVLAARSFEGLLLDEVMEILLSHFRGKSSRGVYGLANWDAEYFPIQQDPTFEQVLRYTEQNGDLANNMRQMLPGDVHAAFQKAAFGIASRKYLDAVSKRKGTNRELPISRNESEEVSHIIILRDAIGLPEYRFDQDFVLSLLMPRPTSLLLPPDSEIRARRSESTPGTMLTQNTFLLGLPDAVPSPIASQYPPLLSGLDNDTVALASTTRRPSVTSVSSNESTSSFFIPSTTQVRWRRPGELPERRHLKTIESQVVKYECSSCNNGIKLTKEEKDKHYDEHLHTVDCVDQTCKRRFCIAERG